MVCVVRRCDVPEPLYGKPFTLGQATALGVSRRVLQSREWRQVFRGVWVHADVDDSRELRLRAASLLLPAYAVVCGLTAAWIYGADVRRAGDLDVHASFPKGRRLRGRRGLIVSQETLQPADVWRLNDVAITTPVRTVFDALRLMRWPEGVVVADALTNRGCTSVDDVRAYFATQRRLRNIRVGARALDAVDPGAESRMETLMRLRLVADGLPRPMTQWEVRDARGAFVARLDLAYPEHKVAVEYDGAWHWKRRRDDDRRRDALRALGWVVIVVSSDDVLSSACTMSARVAAALRAATTASSAT